MYRPSHSTFYTKALFNLGHGRMNKKLGVFKKTDQPIKPKKSKKKLTEKTEPKKKSNKPIKK